MSKKLEKEKQIKPKENNKDHSWNKKKNRKKEWRKSINLKSWFFEKSNKIDEYLARLINNQDKERGKNNQYQE